MGSWLASHALNASMVSMRSRDGWRSMSRCKASRCRRRAQRPNSTSRGSCARGQRSSRAAPSAQQHAFAHFLRGAARERERQNALRRIDRAPAAAGSAAPARWFCRSPRAPAPVPSPPTRWLARAPPCRSRGVVSHARPPRPRAAPARGTGPAIGRSCRPAAVGATAARPAAKSAARFSMRCDHTSTSAARLGMPSSGDLAALRLEDCRPFRFGDEAAIAGIHSAHRRPPPTPSAATARRCGSCGLSGRSPRQSTPPCRSCSRSRRARRPPADPHDRCAPRSRDPRAAPCWPCSSCSTSKGSRCRSMSSHLAQHVSHALALAPPPAWPWIAQPAHLCERARNPLIQQLRLRVR